MSGNILECRELDVYARDLLKIAEKELPKETKKFLRKEGSTLRKMTAKKARQKTKKRTGNYRKGIKKGKIYPYREKEMAIRVYGGKPAHHAHLLEYGHVVKRTKDGPELGFAQGYHVFEEARKDFVPIYEKDTADFIQEVAQKI